MRATRTIAAAAFLAALGPASFTEELPLALQPSFEEGVRALKAGKLDEAEAAFLRVVQRGGKAAYVHNNLGLVYQQRGRHREAVAQFREALRLDPAYAAPRVVLGASLLALDRVREATAELEQAVEHLPREPLARLQLARAYERAANWTGAAEQYRALKDQAPREAEYAYLLGRTYLRLSEWCLRELKKADPGSARLHQALGHNYRVEGRTDLAVRAFERAVRADPTLPEIHLALAQIYLEQKRWADARREIELERAIVPESAGARALEERLRAEEATSP